MPDKVGRGRRGETVISVGSWHLQTYLGTLTFLLVSLHPLYPLLVLTANKISK